MDGLLNFQIFGHIPRITFLKFQPIKAEKKNKVYFM